jgi:hypothetical protein
MGARIIGNFYALAHYLGKTATLSGGDSWAANSLPLVSKFIPGFDAPSFLKSCQSNENHFLDLNLNQWRAAAKTEKFVKGDNHLQIALEILHPFLTRMDPYDSALKRMDNYRSDKVRSREISRASRTMQKSWRSFPESTVNKYDAPESEPNKVHISNIVIELLSKNNTETATCLDVGAFIGAILKLVHDGMDSISSTKNLSLFAVEPQRYAVQFCRKHYPFIEIEEGTSDDLVDGNVRLNLPLNIDVVLVYGVLLLLDTPTIERFLAWASTRAKYLVFGDDVVNTKGRIPVIRQPTSQILHPFEKILAIAGF